MIRYRGLEHSRGITLIGFLVFVAIFTFFQIFLIQSSKPMHSNQYLVECLNRLDLHRNMMQQYHQDFGHYPEIDGGEYKNWALQMRNSTLNDTRWKTDGEYPGDLWFCPATGYAPADADPVNGTYAWPDGRCPPSYPEPSDSGNDRFQNTFPDNAPIAADRLASETFEGNHGGMKEKHNILTWGGMVMHITTEKNLWNEAECFAEIDKFVETGE